jgi:uncharacterized protein
MYAQEGRLSVQGTAIVRVEPDLASIAFAVSRTAATPADALTSVRKSTDSVRAFLSAAGCEIRSSRIALNQEFQRGPADARQLGYVATANFSIVVSDLEAVENLLTGVVTAGANQLASVQFLTSKMKDVRADARKMAVSAAQEKARLFCEAAGIQLGPIIGLSEGHFDPTQRQGGHVPSNVPTADVEDKIGTFSPGSIPVGASVTLAFKLI